MNLSNENIVHKKCGEIEYLQFKKLLEYSNISHAISLKPLDFGGINNFEKNKVLENYKILCEKVDINYENILRPMQTHTDIVECITKKQTGIFISNLNNVDGLITKIPNIALSLTYADCIPIIFFDKEKNIIANIHSGWKGTYNLICKNAITKMLEEYNSRPEDILCFIGPSICKNCFEVENDVYDKFWSKFKNYKKANEIFSIGEIKDGKQKYHIDTVLINRETLENLGLLKENIIESNICTCCMHEKMYSYRAEKAVERNTVIISIKE